MFVFVLMMAVTFGVATSGYRAITGRDLLDLVGTGAVAASARTASESASPKPTASPAPTAVQIPTATAARPTPTPAPAATKRMVIANTDGIGVYLRASPKLDDKLKPWMEGTSVETSGGPVEGDGTSWQKVRTPDGSEGFIPVQFLAAAP